MRSQLEARTTTQHALLAAARAGGTRSGGGAGGENLNNQSLFLRATRTQHEERRAAGARGVVSHNSFGHEYIFKSVLLMAILIELLSYYGHLEWRAISTDLKEQMAPAAAPAHLLRTSQRATTPPPPIMRMVFAGARKSYCNQGDSWISFQD